MFGRCPACFSAIYIEHLPARMHIALPRGIAVHAGVHAARRSVILGEAPHLDDCVALAVDTLRAEVEKIDPAMLDLGSTKYNRPMDAWADVSELTSAAVKNIVLVRDSRVGISETEARVDYGDTFPFEFEAYLDVLLKDGTFADLKTANRAEQPDVWAMIQLRLYSLPWFLAGQPTQLVIDQVALPTAKNPIPRVSFYEAEASPEKFAATRELVIQTARAISTGIFPPRPGWWCKTEHSLAA
jgi:hypothetical protein